MSFVEFIDNIFYHSGDCLGESVCGVRWELTEKSSSHTILGEGKGKYYLYVDLDQSPKYENLGSGMVPVLLKDGKVYVGWETQYPRVELPSDLVVEVLGHILEAFAKEGCW